MSQAKQMGPALKRAMPLVLAIDVAMIAGGLTGYYMTGSVYAVCIPVVIGASMVAYLILRAAKADKDIAAQPAKARSIVE